MQLVDVRIDQATNNPVVLLRVVPAGPSQDGIQDGPSVGPLDGADGLKSRVVPSPTLLPIFIGVTEAQAIRIGLEGRKTPRPMTHDLLASVVAAAGATLRRVIITSMIENVFYADLDLAFPAGDKVAQGATVSARPSDAIALAIRVSAPLYVTASLLAEHGIVDPDLEIDEPAEAVEEEPEELLDEFRQFLDDINPDDFKP
jgi:uncharacterized protein